MYLKSFYTVFFLVLFFKVSAQVSQNHPGTDWHFIETGNTRIIFPFENKEQSFRIANIIEQLQKKTPAKGKKINIILQNRGVFSNGFVGMFPFRSVFFHKPRSHFNSAGSVDWIDRLTLHEHRHLYQFLTGYRQNKFARLMSQLWGEWGWGLIFIAAPKFYFEGNAVWYETILSTSGRGRTAYFFKEQRALLMNDILYPYEKARNGSYKDIVPNIYQYGYVMNRYLDNTYGSGTMDSIFNHTVQYKNIIAPFFKGVKKYTGMSGRTLYQKAYQNLKKTWLQNWKNRPSLPLIREIPTPQTTTVTDYLFPQPQKNGGIIALKKSYTTLPEIVHIKNGIEKKIVFLDLTAQTYFHTEGGKIVWTQLSSDIRYENTQYNDIILYDIATKKRKRISHHKRYFSPRLYGDGRVLCVEQGMSSRQSLVVLDMNTQKVLKKIPFQYGQSLSYPQWKNPSQIIYLKRLKNKIAFFQYGLHTDKEQRISPWTQTPIGAYSLLGNKIYYSASYFATDDIYCLDVATQKITRMSAVKVGVYQPVATEKGVFLSHFTQKGHRLGLLDIKNEGMAFNEKDIDVDKLYDIKNTQQKKFLNGVASKIYQTKPYKGLFKGFKVYRWGVLLGQVGKNTFPFFDVTGGNLLKDVSANFKVSYMGKENTFQYRFSTTYSKYFLALNARLFNMKRITYNLSSKLKRKNFNAFGYSLGVQIPLKQYYRNNMFSLNTATTFQRVHTTNTISYDVLSKKQTVLPNTAYNIFSFHISSANSKNKAYQNVQTRFGQSLSYTYLKELGSKNGEFHSFSGALYLPGIHRNHSLNGRFFWKYQSAENPYQHPEPVLFARGYSLAYTQSLKTLQVNYRLPIAYPDVAFINTLYIRRIRANLFYDHSLLDVVYSRKEQTLRSAGVSLMFDFHLFNIAPFTFEIIPQYLIDQKSYNTGWAIRLNLPES